MIFGNPALVIALTNSARVATFRAGGSSNDTHRAEMPTAADKDARMKKAGALRQAGWSERDIDAELVQLFGF